VRALMDRGLGSAQVDGDWQQPMTLAMRDYALISRKSREACAVLRRVAEDVK